ncbi:MAG: 6-carboxytetrahydropterin synthase QueD [Candidatus Margulisiibacteriota bacterium]
MYELMVEDTFDAAHALRGYEGPCENLHGHTWRIQLYLKGSKLNKLGLLEDFKAIKKVLAATLDQFDHNYINETSPFDKINPTSENLAKYLFDKLKNRYKSTHKVIVWESERTYAAYF